MLALLTVWLTSFTSDSLFLRNCSDYISILVVLFFYWALLYLLCMVLIDLILLSRESDQLLPTAEGRIGITCCFGH